MLFGRFFMIIPHAGHRRQPGAQEARSAVARHVPGHDAAVHRAAGRRDRDRRRADVLPGAQPGPDRRAPADERGQDFLRISTHGKHESNKAIWDSADRPRARIVRLRFVKLDPRNDDEQSRHVRRRDRQRASPRVLLIRGCVTAATSASNLQITLWLWFTVLFANFAEAMAEGRGKAQADTLRKARTETIANRVLPDGSDREGRRARSCARATSCMVSAGEFIPGRRRDHRRRRVGGRDRRSPASRRRSFANRAATARRSPAARACCRTGSRCAITSNPGETFLDRMIALVEGAERQKTPNEIALNILLAGLTIIFLLAVVTLQPFAIYSGAPQSVFVLVSLLVCLIPTTIGGLLSAIGIAGMDRLVQHNVLAMSGRAVEAAGDVNTLLLDKTGTITLGNRQAAEFIPAARRHRERAGRRRAALVAGRRNAGRPLDRRAGQGEVRPARPRAVRRTKREFVPFTAQTRMSGVNLNGDADPQGRASDAIDPSYRRQRTAGASARRAAGHRRAIARSGGTPLVVADRHAARSASST